MFVEYRSYDYGMCYTFGMHETNQSVDDLYKVYSPGRDYGKLFRLLFTTKCRLLSWIINYIRPCCYYIEKKVSVTNSVDPIQTAHLV